MESQQPEYIDTTSPEIVGAEPAPLAKLTSPGSTGEQWQQMGTQVSTFLAQLPDYLGRFFNEYRQLLTTLALIVAAFVTVKVVLAVMDALNGIPLLAPTFELVGIAYSAWFVNRYLLRASNRQELSQELQALKGQVVKDQDL